MSEVTRPPWSPWCGRCCWKSWGAPRRPGGRRGPRGPGGAGAPGGGHQADRMDTAGGDRVWTRDLFSLAEAPRLGCGLMVMEDTTFPWKLTYDEMDYVIEGRLDILVGGETVSAGPGEVLHIPRGSEIQFSVRGGAVFVLRLPRRLAEMKEPGA